MPHRRTAISIVLLLLTGNLLAQQPAPTALPTAGAISKADRERALGILDVILKGIQNLYYDPKMNGLDWNAVTETASRAAQIPVCESRRTVPTRQNLVSIDYLDHVLDPRPEIRLEIEDPPGEKKRLEVKTRVTLSKDLAYRPGAGISYDIIRESENQAHRMRMQLVQFGDVGILKFSEFEYSANKFFDLAGKIRKDKALIIDLRGNPGGAIETLKYFLGMFFDHDVKVFDKVERKKTSPEVVKRERALFFPGKAIVLVDSGSASCSEIFARVMQLEKRGTVVGDLSSGSVMEASSFYFGSSGVDYDAQVTIANLIMADGNSLEHHGVNPDEVKLPQPSDLESGRDPVLTYAAQEFGVTISPEAAWKLFPYEWPKE